MSDDYLRDASGPPDADVERLEKMLGRLRTAPPVPKLPEVRLKPDTTSALWRVRSLAPMLAAAAAVVLMIGQTYRSTRGVASNAASWEVARLDGRPRIGALALAGTGRMAVGQTLVTDAASRARVS